MKRPENEPVLAFETAEAFDAWLNLNHELPTGIFLKIYKKDSGIKSITYKEALDVALCYGWIDGLKLPLDNEAWLQKFCRRRAGSVWSKTNTDHVGRLISEGRMKPPGIMVIERARMDGTWDVAYDSPGKMTLPDDFLTELSRNKPAELFFQTLNKTNRYSIAFRLQTAKKPETREKRMRDIIEMLAAEKKFH